MINPNADAIHLLPVRAHVPSGRIPNRLRPKGVSKLRETTLVCRVFFSSRTTSRQRGVETVRQPAKSRQDLPDHHADRLAEQTFRAVLLALKRRREPNSISVQCNSVGGHWPRYR
jgi:hypothetical protein